MPPTPTPPKLVKLEDAEKVEDQVVAPTKTNYTEQWEQEFMQRLYKNFAELVGPLDQPLLEEIARRAKVQLKDKTEISMLEIGAGGGRSLAYLVAEVAKDKKVDYAGIDVSAEQQKLFGESANSFPENVHIQGYTLSPWQEYTPTQKYDLILAQHSWYGIGGDTKYIYKLLNTLNEGGVAFVMLSGEETVSISAWKAIGEEYFSAEKFEEALVSSGVAFEKVREASDTYKREDFYKNGRLTEKGVDLCSYLYKKGLKGDEQEVIDMMRTVPDEAFRYPKFLFTLKK